MGWFGERAQRLCDVREGQPALSKCRNAVFFAPHTSERMATLPLISELAGMLRAEGIASATHSVEDMRDRVISLSAQIGRLGLKKGERAVLERLYRLKDATVRLDLVCKLLEANPGAMLLEIHSLDRDYRLPDRFPWARHFHRLPGSRVLFLDDYASEYSVPVMAGISLLEALEGPRLKEAAGIIGLDCGHIRARAPIKLGFVAENAHRSALIEVPAPSRGTPEDTGRMAAFEIAYGFSMSGHHTLTPEEVAMLASALA